MEHALKTDKDTRDILEAIRDGDDLACRIAQAASRDPLYDLAWSLLREGFTAEQAAERLSHAQRDYPKEASDKVLGFMKKGR